MISRLHWQSSKNATRLGSQLFKITSILIWSGYHCCWCIYTIWFEHKSKCKSPANRNKHSRWWILKRKCKKLQSIVILLIIFKLKRMHPIGSTNCKDSLTCRLSKHLFQVAHLLCIKIKVHHRVTMLENLKEKHRLQFKCKIKVMDSATVMIITMSKVEDPSKTKGDRA